MAQTAYTGIQGSGKSYEVVQGVIVPNIAKGRRVVTNVAGLDYEKIKAYCIKEYAADPDKLGQIIQVDNSRIDEPFFFPLEESDSPFLAAIAKTKDSGLVDDLRIKHEAWKDSFLVKGGDIIILDECWRWYTADTKLPDGHLKFFRMHRHFLHPVTGQSCDIVLIVQDIADLRRNIRATVEKSFLMQKHIDLGLPDRYVVTVYGGNKQIGRSFIEDFQKKYNPDIFPLYQSHSQKVEGGASAKEERVDNRGSVFNRPLIKYGLPVAAIMIFGSAFYMYRFFNPPKKEVPPASAQTGGASKLPEVQKKSKEGYSSEWRLVGVYSHNGDMYILKDAEGRQRVVSVPSAVKMTRGEVELMLPGGEFVAQWSGPVQASKK